MIMDEHDNVEFDARVNRYLKGRMTVGEATAFELELKGNAELRARATTIARMIKAMLHEGTARDSQVVDAMRHAGRDDVEAMSKAVSREKIPFMPGGLTMNFAAAANAAFNFATGRHRPMSDRVSKMCDEFLAYFPASSFTRNKDSKTKELVMALYAAVASNRNIKAIIAILEKLWAVARRMLFGRNSEYSFGIGWMLANAYIRIGRNQEAKEVLRLLEKNADPKSDMADKAGELRDKIDGDEPKKPEE